jgi:arylsulfatase
MRTHHLLIVPSIAVAALLPAALAGAEAKPNIVLVMTDDQGYGDLACHGNPVVKTPNLDRLHSESVRFTDFNVSPTCAPTRSALMTGRHEFRNGVTHTIEERERLTLKATTLAEVLKAAGYATGIFGKWHLGDEAPYQPDRRGFDEVFIHGAGGIGQTYAGSCGDAPGNSYFDPAILHNRVFVRTKGYCTDVFFRQAISWMDGERTKDRPFFAYITPNAPHGPLHVPPEYEAMYAGKVPLAAAKFFGMVTNIDENVGRLLAKLDDWKLAPRTLLIFLTDNGGTAGVSVYNAGMRGSKGTPYRGGTRVPSFWRWPGKLPRGVDVEELAAHIDILPTLAEIAGATLTEEVRRQVQGRSLVPLLVGANAGAPKAPWPDRVLITHVGRWPRGKAAESRYARCSVRDARFHLVNAAGKGERWELFDVLADPGEKTSVIEEHPEVATRLRASLDAWWEETVPLLVNEDAVGPKVNPFKELYWRQFGGGPTE